MIFIYSLIPGLIGLEELNNHALFILYLAVFHGTWMLYSDIKDIHGDKQVGKQTLAILLGVSRLALLSLLFSSLTIYFGVIYISQNFTYLMPTTIILWGSLWLIQFTAALFPTILKSKNRYTKWIGYFQYLFYLWLIVSIYLEKNIFVAIA